MPFSPKTIAVASVSVLFSAPPPKSALVPPVVTDASDRSRRAVSQTAVSDLRDPLASGLGSPRATPP